MSTLKPLEHDDNPRLVPLTTQKIKQLRRLDLNESVQSVPVIGKEELEEIGFTVVHPDDFTGVSPNAYVVDLDNPFGRSVVIVDLKPRGNRGNPALHVYFSSTESPTLVYLASFNPQLTKELLEGIVNLAQNFNPSEQKVGKAFTSAQEILNTMESLNIE